MGKIQEHGTLCLIMGNRLGGLSLYVEKVYTMKVILDWRLFKIAIETFVCYLLFTIKYI